VSGDARFSRAKTFFRHASVRVGLKFLAFYDLFQIRLHFASPFFPCLSPVSATMFIRERSIWPGFVVVGGLILSGCARIEAIDASGVHTVSWALGASLTPMQDSKTQIVRAEGFGMHQVGSTWSLGLQRIEIVATSPSECQLIVLDGMRGMGGSTQVPLNFKDICPNHAAVRSAGQLHPDAGRWSVAVHPASASRVQ